MSWKTIWLVLALFLPMAGCKNYSEEAQLKRLVETPPDSEFSSTHHSCIVELEGGGSLVSHSFSFEDNNLARERLDRGIESALRNTQRSIQIGSNDTTKFETTIDNSCIPKEDTITCSEIVSPTVVMLNQAMTNPFDPEKNPACHQTKNSMITEIGQVRFPIPPLMYCYLLVDKTREIQETNVQNTTETILDSRYRIQSDQTNRRGWFSSTNYSSTSGSQESAARSTSNFQFSVNTKYATSSSIASEITIDTSEYTQANNKVGIHDYNRALGNILATAYQHLLSKYQSGNTVNDVLHEVPYCVPERILIAKGISISQFIISMQYFPYNSELEAK
jgi:hypothetical protein